MLSKLVRSSGVPHTTTSKTFCSSNRLPTWMPDSSDVAARRTSPGLTPWAAAFSRSTLISTVGSVIGAVTDGPSIPEISDIAARTSSALVPRTARSWP